MNDFTTKVRGDKNNSKKGNIAKIDVMDSKKRNNIQKRIPKINKQTGWRKKGSYDQVNDTTRF